MDGARFGASVDAIGGVASHKYDIQPETPGQISEVDIARQDATNRELFRKLTDFAQGNDRVLQALCERPIRSNVLSKLR